MAQERPTLLERGGLSPQQVREVALLARALSQAPGLPTLLSRLGHGVRALLEADLLALAMRGADGKTWALFARGGQEPAWVELPPSGSAIDLAVDQNRTVRLDRPAGPVPVPDSAALGTLAAYPSAIAVPLRGAQGPMGALAVFASRPYAYDPGHEAMVELLGSTVEQSARRFLLLDELSRAHKELTRAEGLPGGLMRGFAADLTPELESLVAAIQRLQGEVLTDEAPVEARRLFDELKEAASDLAGLVGNVAELARFEAGQVKLARSPVPLRAFLSERLRAKAALARARGVLLLWRVEPEELRVAVDAKQLGRVVDALVLDALGRTPRGGQVAAVARLGRGYVDLAVGDTGSLAPDQRDRIFTEPGPALGDTPLARSAKGLSLYFCRLVVELHGGRIRLDEPPPGVGALVRLALPA